MAFCCPLFYWYCLWLKKPFSLFFLHSIKIIKTYKNNLLSVDKATNPFFSNVRKKCHSLIKQTMLQEIKSGHSYIDCFCRFYLTIPNSYFFSFFNTENILLINLRAILVIALFGSIRLQYS